MTCGLAEDRMRSQKEKEKSVTVISPVLLPPGFQEPLEWRTKERAVQERAHHREVPVLGHLALEDFQAPSSGVAQGGGAKGPL